MADPKILKKAQRHKLTFEDMLLLFRYEQGLDDDKSFFRTPSNNRNKLAKKFGEHALKKVFKDTNERKPAATTIISTMLNWVSQGKKASMSDKEVKDAIAS